MSFRTGVSLLSNLLVRDTLITARPFFDSTFIFLFLLLLIAYDLWSTGKVHHATAWAAAFVVVVGQLRVPTGSTAAFHSLAN